MEEKIGFSVEMDYRNSHKRNTSDEYKVRRNNLKESGRNYVI